MGKDSSLFDALRIISRGDEAMIKFVFGVLVGVLLCFLFLYFGGGKTVKRVGENLVDTGKKMEVMEETIRKEKEDLWIGGKKKILKEEKETPKKTQ
jgi:hypothetical protein